jgi:hypothetical protein
MALIMLVMNLYIPQLSFTKGTNADMRHSLLDVWLKCENTIFWKDSI